MQINLLTSARLKIENADSHIKDLAAQISTFFQTDPKPFRSYVDEEDSRKVFKIQALIGPPGLIYSRIGDTLSNTRSALDHLAGALAVKNGHTSGRVNFPIVEDQKKFEALEEDSKRKFGADAWHVICDLRPYRGGNNLLWSLNKLRNMDIHETVVPIASAVAGAEWVANVLLVEPGQVDTARSPVRFDENRVARIWRVPASATIINSETRFSLDIAFTKVEPVEGQPVVAVLQQFLDLTRRTVALFEERDFT